jgi:hypothetical protein
VIIVTIELPEYLTSLSGSVVPDDPKTTAYPVLPVEKKPALFAARM